MRIVQAFATYFVRGLLVLAPAGITIYVFYLALTWLEALLRLESRFGVAVPGVGLAILVVAVTAIGWVASRTIASALIDLAERVFGRLPLVRLVYTSIKDLLEAFVGEEKRFNRPVLVRMMPGADARVIGFVTRPDMVSLGLVDHVAVYLPTSYGMAGHLVIVPHDCVTPLHADVTSVMTFVISGGVSGSAARIESAG